MTIEKFFKKYPFWQPIIIVLAALATRLIGLGWPYGDYDEGVYTATIRSLAQGLPLYSKTYDSQGPLFFYLGEVFYKISATIVSLRLIPVICSLVIIYLAFLLVKKYIGIVAAIFASLYLTFDTAFLTISRTFQIDIPWLAFSFGAFYFLLKFDEGQNGWDIFSLPYFLL